MHVLQHECTWIVIVISAITITIMMEFHEIDKQFERRSWNAHCRAIPQHANETVEIHHSVILMDATMTLLRGDLHEDFMPCPRSSEDTDDSVIGMTTPGNDGKSSFRICNYYNTY